MITKKQNNKKVKLKTNETVIITGGEFQDHEAKIMNLGLFKSLVRIRSNGQYEVIENKFLQDNP